MKKQKLLKVGVGLVFILCCVYFSVKAFTQEPIRVLITAPEGYSERFKHSFSGSYIQPIAVPMIETEVNTNSEVILDLLSHPQEIDFIAFSSRKAVQALEKVIEQKPDIRDSLRTIKLYAVGKDADYLREVVGAGQMVMVPQEPSPAGIANDIRLHEETDGKKIAVFVPHVEGLKEPYVVPDFIERLEDIGLQVLRCDVYTTHPVESNRLQDAVSKVEEGKIKDGPCVLKELKAKYDL